ncbi:MAG: aminoglycoside phosphotransferase family protein [Christensenellaceae bacterium]|nr:aminoglycoside phosphotransferase family protein [Christensenellaceae bacterium]
MSDIDAQLKSICKSFCISGDYVDSEELKIGNVNKTYKVTFCNLEGAFESYIVQAINGFAFHNPEQVMHNIDLVTKHIRSKASEQSVPYFHHTAEQKPFMFDGERYWRACDYIPSHTFYTCDNGSIMRETGRAFGRFQRQLEDFDFSKLFETIPNFHNTPKRLETLFANAKSDPCGLAKSVQPELNYIASVRDEACLLTQMLEDGKLPLRVTHNDTKINNLLFDQNKHKVLAIVDLDTVMPGLVAHDFGDAIRYAANRVAEDSPDYEKAGCDLTMFRAFTEGFLSQTSAILTETEIGTLALSPFIMAVELASRFLDDYLIGNRYFNINYPEHNLTRARCQLALAHDLKQKQPRMQAIVHECLRLIER